MHTTTHGLILAGGKATRMGGCDKGLVQLGNQAMVAWVSARLRRQINGRLIINANRNQPQYGAYADEVVSDAHPDFQGPVAGMAAGLSAIDPDSWLLVAPCDAPNLPADLGQKLHHAAKEAGTHIAVAADASRLQPVFCLLHARIAQSLTDYLSAGERKIDRLFSYIGYASVVFDDAAFSNLNSDVELQNFVSTLDAQP